MYQPFFWGDYHRDTGDLSIQEHGAYLLLISEYWNRGGPLPSDGERILRAIKCMTDAERNAARIVLVRFFKEEADGWHHSRIDRDLERHRQHSEKKREAARVAANARWHGDAPRMPDAMPVACQPSPHPYPSPESKPQRGGLKRKYEVGFHLNDDGWQRAKEAAPGWDKYHLAQKFDDNVNTGKFARPTHPNKAFPAWCATYTKGKPPQ